jgi:hypothetical protein
MSTKYPISVASDGLALGDAVVGYWNSGMTRWEVKRANASTLAVMPTVLGIVNEFDATPGHVTVALPGELADNRITGLNPGGSLTANIVAVDPSAPIGASNLIRVERPNGSEFVVGTTDADGNLTIQPRASRDTSPQHVFSVCAYGAAGDGRLFHDAQTFSNTTLDSPTLEANFSAADVGATIRIGRALANGAALKTTIAGWTSVTEVTLATPATLKASDLPAMLWRKDNGPAIQAAVNAIVATGTGGTLFFPGPAVYVVDNSSATRYDIPDNVQVVFGDGAILASADASITIEGRVTCHPLREVFGGAGYTDPVDPVGEGVTVTGDPVSNYTIVVTILTTGDLTTPATFQYSVNGQVDSDYFDSTIMAYPPRIYDVAPTFDVPDTGLTLEFAATTYTAGDTYKITAYAPIILAPATLEHASIRLFGAIPDDSSSATQAANVDAIHSLLGALRASGNFATRVVVRGIYYLADTLHIHQGVVLEGAARSDSGTADSSRSLPGAAFYFPPGVTGVQIHTTLQGAGGGTNSVLRNLSVLVATAPEADQAGYGVWMNSPATLDHVNVEMFGMHGIFVDGGSSPPATNGGAAGFLITNCNVGGCGGDGFHTLGSDSNVGLISRCSSRVNAGWGFVDETTGNTYLACQGEYNQGDSGGRFEGGYKTSTEGTNESVFISCYTGGPAGNEVAYPALILGGGLGELLGNAPASTTITTSSDVSTGTINVENTAGFPPTGTIIVRTAEANYPQIITYKGLAGGNTFSGCTGGDGWTVPGSTVFNGTLPPNQRAFGLGPAGYASGRPISYLNSFGPVQTLLETGQNDGYYGGVLNFSLPYQKVDGVEILDTNVLRYEDRTGWWGIDNVSPGRTSIRFPTALGAPRRIAPLFENGIFYGSPASLSSGDASTSLISHSANDSKPSPTTKGGTWELGDVVWNNRPTERAPIGWVCTQPGTDEASIAGIATATVDTLDDTLLHLGPPLPPGLSKWQYITLAGVGPYQIVNDPLHPAPDPPPPSGSARYRPPRLSARLGRSTTAARSSRTSAPSPITRVLAS